MVEVRRGKRAVKKKLRYDEDTEESSVMSSTSFAVFICCSQRVLGQVKLMCGCFVRAG